MTRPDPGAGPDGSRRELAGRVLGTGEVADWLAGHAPAGVPVGVAVAGTFGRGTGTVSAIAVATGAGEAAWFDPAGLFLAFDAADAARLLDARLVPSASTVEIVER